MTENWIGNKEKANIAEEACRLHFEQLGYNVEDFGIEKISKEYPRLRKDNAGTYLVEIREKIQNMPDFLISGVYPEKAGELTGKSEALLVEAKYKEIVIFEDFNKEILKKYSNLLDDLKISLMIYLVTRSSRRLRSSTKSNEVYVHIGLFRPSQPKAEFEWLAAGGTGGHLMFKFLDEPKAEFEWLAAGGTGLNKFPFTYGCNGSDDFNTIYAKVVKPVLDKRFAANVAS
ncbi:MAG TPA: hypothetical protein VFF26_04320 [Gallionella sp.]|nr:hypothetical protein [Gallionella sp.]